MSKQFVYVFLFLLAFFCLVPNFSFTQAQTTPLPAPEGFNYNCTPDGTEVTINWKPITGADKYAVRLNREPFNDWANTAAGDSMTTVTPPSLTIAVVPGSKYSYDVQGVRAGEPYPFKGARAPFKELICEDPTGTLPPPGEPPTPIITTTPIPTITAPEGCALKSKGDANCDKVIDDFDYHIWEYQIKGLEYPDALPNAADFDLKNGVDLNDFEIWRRSRQAQLLITGTPIPTDAPPAMEGAAFYEFANPAQYQGKTVQEVCETYGPGWSCTPSCTSYVTKNQAYFSVAGAPPLAQTTVDDNCQYVLPSTTTYFSACCAKSGIVVPTPTSEPKAYKAFLTSQKYSANLGGIEGADAKCQAAADTAGLEGKFIAWISIYGNDIKYRFPSSKPGYLGYARTDGTLIARTFEALFDNTLLAPIDVNEYGQKVLESDPNKTTVFTGTHSSGISNNYDCNRWTSTSSGYKFSGGNHTRTTYFWTVINFEQPKPPCSETEGANGNHLYCFEIESGL